MILRYPRKVEGVPPGPRETKFSKSLWIIHGTGARARSVHVNDGWKNWMLIIMARTVRMRVGPVSVMRTTGFCVMHMGDSEVSDC